MANATCLSNPRGFIVDDDEILAFERNFSFTKPRGFGWKNSKMQFQRIYERRGLSVGAFMSE
jgi:hypothetical protein